jgi:acetyltransferase-like isoleucine patch superfamily enzyme
MHRRRAPGETTVTVEELARLLQDLYLARDEQLRQRFSRSLPLADGLFDRWERAKRLGFGEGTSIYHSACVFGDVTVGANTWIGPNVVLDGSGGGLSIGSYCSISAGVHVYTHDTVRWALSGGKLPYRREPVTIGNCVYIGAQSVIAAGVSIGDRCIVSANSLVLDHVEGGTAVGGTPARPIGRIAGEGEAVRVEWNHRGLGNPTGDGR